MIEIILARLPRPSPRSKPSPTTSASHPTELQKLFSRWAGLSPKGFLQAVTLDHAKRLLREAAAARGSLELRHVGLGRLHDLFVTHEAMSPGDWKTRGGGLTIR